MPCSHLVRVGALGQVGRFAALDATCYPRGTRIIVRTDRGLEIGQVLTAPEFLAEGGEMAPRAEPDGQIIRGMTIEDELLEARLLKRRDQAHEACQARIEALGLQATLLEVEHLFDGRTLVFYFLGQLAPELEAITAELAEVYETQAQFRSFVDTLTHGCGPGCGTEAATGGGCTSCATGCAVAGACSTRGKK